MVSIILIIGIFALSATMVIAIIIASENQPFNPPKPYAECNGVYVSCIYHDTQEILDRLDKIESRLNQTDRGLNE